MDQKRKSILIVDDEPVNLRVLVELLQSKYKVLAARSGQNALDVLVKNDTPDLVLLDVMMPGMDGYSFLQQLRANPLYREIPVIFVTALQDEVDEKYGFELGANDYITKPIRPAIVLARVEAHLELKSARDRLQKHNLELESEVKKRMHENILIQDVTLNALAELAETRDSDTGHHIVRTQSYVEALVQHMAVHSSYASDFSEALQSHIIKAAPLHDIGKVGIPDAILLKPEKLTEHEYETMKEHTRIGGQTINNAISKALGYYKEIDQEISSNSLDFLHTARDIALYHHERWDGAGYPDRLSAEAIPLSARMMAVADVYDAMTTKRVYKPAIRHEEVADYIKFNSGKHFDPEVVEAFEATQDSFRRVRKLYADTE